MPWELQITITSRLRPNHQARIQRAMHMAGQAYQSETRRYPGKMQGPWPDVLGVRTNNLAKSANWAIVGEGSSKPELYLYAPGYYLFLLKGTGLFGPRHEMIYPTTARMLAIPKVGGGYLFARAVRGSIWEGKEKALRDEIVRGFIVGIK